MVTGPVYGSNNSSYALKFVHALFQYGHKVTIVFFYHDGIYNANSLVMSAVDEINIQHLWADLSKRYNVKLHVCITAAARRGVIDSQQATEYNSAVMNFSDIFDSSSLGILIQYMMSCDRFIQF